MQEILADHGWCLQNWKNAAKILKFSSDFLFLSENNNTEIYNNISLIQYNKDKFLEFICEGGGNILLYIND